MSTITNRVLRKIIALRKKHGYSQTAVAAALRMSQATYSDLEAGRTKLDLARLEQLANLYNVTIHHLLEDLPGTEKITQL